jgi:hypothetical protein
MVLLRRLHAHKHQKAAPAGLIGAHQIEPHHMAIVRKKRLQPVLQVKHIQTM